MPHEEHQERIMEYLSGGLKEAQKQEARRLIRDCEACQDHLVKLKAIQTSIHQLKDEEVLELLKENETLRKVFERPLVAGEMSPDKYAQIMESCDQVFHDALAAAGVGARERIPPHPTQRIWRSAAFAFASAAVLAILLVIDSRKSVTRRDTLIAEQKETIEQLNRKMGEVSPASQTVAEQEQKIAELRQKVDALSRDNQKQAGEVAELSQRIQKYRQPGADAVLVAFLSTSRQSERPTPIKLPKDTLFLNLQTRTSREAEHQSYRLVIRDHLKKVVSQNDRARRAKDGTFNHIVARELLKPGEYSLEIYGIDGNQEHLISQNHFRIVASQ